MMAMVLSFVLTGGSSSISKGKTAAGTGSFAALASGEFPSVILFVPDLEGN